MLDWSRGRFRKAGTSKRRGASDKGADVRFSRHVSRNSTSSEGVRQISQLSQTSEGMGFELNLFLV